MTGELGTQRRILAGLGQAHVPAELLQSIFCTELLRPSKKLWLVSPWVSDIEVIDNSGRRFGALDSTWEAGPILLSEFISTYLSRGSDIALVMNFDRHNNWMVNKLHELSDEYPEQLTIRQLETIHAKGIVSDHFALTGSMNITYSGVHINSEHIDYTADPVIVNETLAQFEEYLGQP